MTGPAAQQGQQSVLEHTVKLCAEIISHLCSRAEHLSHRLHTGKSGRISPESKISHEMKVGKLMRALPPLQIGLEHSSVLRVQKGLQKSRPLNRACC